MKNPRKLSTKKRNSKNSASRKQDWRMETWMDERTGAHFVEIDFPRIDGSRGIVQVPMDQIDTPSAVRRMLRKQGASMGRDSREADKFVAKFLLNIPTTVNVVAAVPGWRDGLFLLPGRVIGESSRRYRLRQSGDGQSVIGATSGTLDGWKLNVAELAMNSSYIAFGIIAALAAPLQRFASLSEGVIFNLAGESSTGKTTAAKVAATVSGAPRPLPSWNITNRRLDERAAEYSDILLVLDDTEKRSGKTKQTAQALSDAAHVMTDGQSRDYSDVVTGPDRLERLHWRCLAISTSPVTAEAYALKAGNPRSDGERVRFIDIAVPDRENGGVFDYPGLGYSLGIEGAKLRIRELEDVIKEYHGVALEPWIKYLLSDVTSEDVNRLIRRFIEKVSPDGTGFDERFAAKFGLVYAAGKLAIRAGILPWPKGFPLEVVEHCYRQARSVIVDFGKMESGAAVVLLEAAEDRQLFPTVKKGERLPAEVANTWAGIQRQIDGCEILAVRGDHLSRIVGSAEAAAQLVIYLKREGMLLEGHGGKLTRQIPIRIEGSKRNSVKMRFYVVDYNGLCAAGQD